MAIDALLSLGVQFDQLPKLPLAMNVEWYGLKNYDRIVNLISLILGWICIWKEKGIVILKSIKMQWTFLML